MKTVSAGSFLRELPFGARQQHRANGIPSELRTESK